MPVMFGADAQLDWSWVVWQRAEDDLLLVVTDGSHAGRAIDYSTAGHRMHGFRIHSRADDVIDDAGRWQQSAADSPAQRIDQPQEADQLRPYGCGLGLDRWSTTGQPATPRARSFGLHLRHLGSQAEALPLVELLGLAIAEPDCTAIVAGQALAWHLHGTVAGGGYQADGEQRRGPVHPGKHHWQRPGRATATTAANGRRAVAEVQVLDARQPLAERVLHLHRERYQRPEGFCTGDPW